jgi:hypothetical protein
MRLLREKKMVADVCVKLGLTGLVLIGCSKTLTDGLYLS